MSKECSVAGCNNKHLAGGFCNMHYKRMRLHGDPSVTHAIKHGMYKSRAYQAWASMRDRCGNPRHRCFRDYGGRGIKVCSRWNEFENFVADMGQPDPGLSLDRIDNDRGYEPQNCRWATTTTQARNKRGLRPITANGVTRLACEWAEQTGIPYGTISTRLHAGWSEQDAVTVPPRPRQRVLTVLGEQMNATEAAAKYGISAYTILGRLKLGWPDEQAVLTPVRKWQRKTLEAEFGK